MELIDYLSCKAFILADNLTWMLVLSAMLF